MSNVSMRTIQLSNGQVTYVDDADYDWLSKYNWSSSRGYPQTKGYYVDQTFGRILCTLSMHRMIMGCVPGDGKVVDHIDRNPLNNQRSNLRIVTQSQNCLNSDYKDRQRWARRVTVLARSYRKRLVLSGGLRWSRANSPIINVEKRRRKFTASTWWKGKKCYLGLYMTREGACYYGQIMLQFVQALD